MKEKTNNINNNNSDNPLTLRRTDGGKKEVIVGIFFTEIFESNVWLGLQNPTGLPCQDYSCEGLLKWDLDGSDFIFDSSWLNQPLHVTDLGAAEQDNCFYFDVNSLGIGKGDCSLNHVAVCQSSTKCPSKKMK